MDLNVLNLDEQIPLEHLTPIINELKQNRVYLSKMIPVYNYHKNLWFDMPIKGYTYQIQTLKMISYLLAYYKKTLDDSCIEKALEYFYLWVESEKKQEHQTEPLQVVAFRFLVINDLYSLVKKLDLCILDDVFDDAFERHGHFLSKEMNYKPNHLFGIDADIALFIGGAVFQITHEGESKTEWINLAKERLLKQLAFFVTEEGIFLGSTPIDGYALLVRLIDFLTFLNQLDHNETFIQKINQVKIGLEYTLYAMIEPNFMIPAIGESQTIPFAYERLKNHLSLQPYYEYLYTKGKLGKRSFYSHVFLKPIQCFIAMNGDYFSPDFYKLYFYANFSSLKNKHNDDLSFIIYHHKKELFTECGSTMENSPLMGVYAHNTICIDRHDFIIKEHLNQSGIVNAITSEEWSFSCGISMLYEDTYIKRCLLALKDRILIIDEVISTLPHEIELLFHLNLQLEVTLSNKQFTFSLHDQPIGHLLPLFSTCAIDVLGVDKFPASIQDLHHSQGIRLSGHGSHEIIITEINFQNPVGETTVHVQSDAIHLSLLNTHYQIIRGRKFNSLKVNDTDVPDDLNENKTLMKAIDEFFKNM